MSNFVSKYFVKAEIMTTRRNFLKNTGAIAAGAAFSPLMASPLRASVSPNDKFTIALIGCHGMGMYDLKDHLKSPEIDCGGLCDVDENVLNERASEIGKLTGKTPKLFKDYRKLLEDKSIDAVIIGTPDHWHCLMTTDACEAGKDVYVEKPAGRRGAGQVRYVGHDPEDKDLGVFRLWEGKTKSTRHTGAVRCGLRSMAWPRAEEAVQLQPVSWKLEILLGTGWWPDDRLGCSSS